MTKTLTLMILLLLPAPHYVTLNRDLVILNDGVGNEEVTMLQGFLKQRLGVPVRVEKNFIDLSSARHKDRGQYDYSVMLDALRHVVRGDEGRVILLTSKDTFGNGLNWSTGVSYCNSTVSVVSVCRLNPSFWREAPNKKLWHERIRKIALHELGHTFGRAEHCVNWRCAIHGSNSIEDIDRTGKDYCPDCAKMAEQKLKKVR